MATTTVAPNPNQIQLEVQVNQNFDNNQDTEPELPDAEFPEEEEDTSSPPTPEPTEENSCLPYMAFLVILLLFLWPFLLTFINYYTDFNLWLFIKSTHDDYNNAHSNIKTAKTNITILTCTFNGENSLNSFEKFLMNTTSDTQCQCNYIDNTSPNWNCSHLSTYPWTTTNIEYNACMDYSSDINSTCLQCAQCASDSLYPPDSAYHLYSLQLYNDINHRKEQEKYCSPTKMAENIADNVMDSYFTHCANSCIVFFVISGIWIVCGLCSGCKVRYKDLKRSYLWCFKGEEPKQRAKYQPDDTINQDEFTLFIVAMLLLHVFEDVTQCIIGIMFSIYKQSNGGSDCILGLDKKEYRNSVDLVSYTGGTNIVAIMSRDSVVEIFFIFSFLSVFFSGLYGIRLFNFDLQKILIYPWWKNVLYVVVGVLLGLFFIFLVLSPFWGAVWLNADFLYLTKGETTFLMYTFIAGLGGYVIAICMPLCFADQLECGCECGDGCCCGG